MLKEFPSKVLLLGEYTILNGSKAFALPYDEYRGVWSFTNDESEARESSRKSLYAFQEHSGVSALDLDRMKNELDQGLWFDSTIPHGFGLGSSGAVIAAILERYGNVSNDLQENKRTLARMEDFFHGSSSGLDPLVSLIQNPLLIHSFNEVEVLSQRPNLKGFFLLNTGKPRQTGPLVNVYQEKMKDPQFKQGCADILSKEVNFAIECLLKDDPTNLFHHLWHVSKFQWEFFPEMIPTKERGIWSQGIETGDYILKLCGAGGGGFILGYSQKYGIEELKEILGTSEIFELR
jgi:mevalonate kinase